jgi:ribosomal protein S18 acetylase RimI-like enzyme
MAEEPGWEIVPLSRAHERTGFDCGDPALGAFLARYARQNQDRGISRTYVATRPGEARVVGYLTLSTGAVEVRDIPEAERRRLPRHPVPVVHLGRLAVDRSVAGQGLGERLLVEALRIALRASESVGAFAVEVVAKNEAARAFYAKYGFVPLDDDRLHLYLPMGTIRRALSGRGGEGPASP